MKVLVTGGSGQLGRALVHAAPASAIVLAPAHSELTIASKQDVMAYMARHTPDVVFNTAAYTAVDRAESDSQGADLVNATAVGFLADACRVHGAQLVHISTDFVFDGVTSRAYRPADAPRPLSVYGASKWRGEQAAGDAALVVRTSWLYAATGTNFVRTMLRLMRERDTIRVVADQVSAPTAAPGFARALWSLAALPARGLFHYSDSGIASWYDFAVAIHDEALALGLLLKPAAVLPISSAEYPSAAARPAFSKLDASATWTALGAPAPHWRRNLQAILQQIKHDGPLND